MLFACPPNYPLLCLMVFIKFLTAAPSLTSLPRSCSLLRNSTTVSPFSPHPATVSTDARLNTPSFIMGDALSIPEECEGHQHKTITGLMGTSALQSCWKSTAYDTSSTTPPSRWRRLGWVSVFLSCLYWSTVGSASDFFTWTSRLDSHVADYSLHHLLQSPSHQ